VPLIYGTGRGLDPTIPARDAPGILHRGKPLLPLGEMIMAMPTDEELRQIARQTAEKKAGFYTHFAIYVVVNLFLIAIWYITGAGFPWFVFILFGWGIGIAAHYMGTFHGQAYVDGLTEKEYRKLKDKGG
jgi:hypothetical protein